MVTVERAPSAVACADVLIDLLPSLGSLLIESLQGGPPAARLTTAQYRALFFLAERDLMSGELARYLGVTASSTTTMVDGLVHRGLVERVSSPDDRRCVLVRLTGSGSVCLQQARARMLQQVSAVAAQLQAADRDRLEGGLVALGAVLAGRPCPIASGPQGD